MTRGRESVRSSVSSGRRAAPRGERNSGGQRGRDLHDRVGNRGALAATRKARIARDDEKVAGDAARRAGRGSLGTLPHRREAERILGTDLSSVRSAVGPDAAAACDALGAQAFAVGNLTVFGGNPDLATVVHEAAHAIQQRDANGALPSRLPILRHDASEEREARNHEAGGGGRITRTGKLAIAMKPKITGAAVTPGGTDLLPSLGSPTRVAHLDPGTQVMVTPTDGPAYFVTVTSGEHVGKSGYVPGNVLEDLPDAAPSSGGGSTFAIASPQRDVKLLDDAQLQSELTTTGDWLYSNPLHLKRDEMEAYYRSLTAEWSVRHPSSASPAASNDSPFKIKINTPIIIPLDDPNDSLLGSTLLRIGKGQSAGTPIGAQVMGSDYFGGGSYVYNFQSKKELPIPWHLGFDARGIQSEPLITNEFYAPLNPEVLPRGMPAADISIGGTYSPIEGFTWLKDPALDKSVKTPWVGWEIEGPTIVGYKTVDTIEQYRDPGSLEKALMKYVSEIMTDEIGKTGTDRGPGQPRIRIQIKDPVDRILHVQLRAEPTDQQASEIDTVRELALKSGVKLVVLGPPMASKATVIDNQTRNPAPAYIPGKVPDTSINPVLDRQQARGTALQVGAQVVFGMLNDWGASIQKADEQSAFNASVKEAQDYISKHPETGASLWITWYGSGAPWFSLNQPGGTFGGITTVYERMSSESPPPGVYKDQERSYKHVWIPPEAALAATPENDRVVNELLGGTMGRIVRLQKEVDKYAGEDWAQRYIWYGRHGTITGHELDDARYYYSLAKTAVAEGRLDDAEANIAKARKALDDVQLKINLYR